MGKVTEKLLKDFNDPIFDSSYEIYSPKRKISTKSKKMKQLKIICPNCNETFLADEVLQKYLKEKKKQYQKEIKVREKLLIEKYNLDFKLKEKRLEKELANICKKPRNIS